MKKWLALVLALCCLASLMGGCVTKKLPENEGLFQELRPGGEKKDWPFGDDTQQGQNVKYEPGLVAEPLDADEMAAPPASGLQDLRYWVDDLDDAALRKEPTEDDDTVTYTYTSEMDIVKAYIQMLQRNGWTLVGMEEGYKGGYYSWGLTCDACPDAEMLQQMFNENRCHLSIHWTDSENYKFTFVVSEDISVCDLGLRKDGGRVGIAPTGPSACAGLERLSDGSYRTTDGRLAVHPGSAMVIRDGKEYTVDARYENDGSYEVLETEYYYRNEGFKLKFQEETIMEGDIYRLWDLDKYRAYWEADRDSAASLLLDHFQVFIANDGEWSCPGRDGENYESLFVRMMYREKGGVMVLYLCARFDEDEPEEIEALVAVDMSQGQGEVVDATYLQVGDKITLRYHPPVGSESYELFSWQVLEGDGNVWIDGSGKTCEVRALDAGSAVIRVTYEYTVEGYDVLTGYPENQPKSATQDYYFIIE